MRPLWASVSVTAVAYLATLAASLDLAAPLGLTAVVGVAVILARARAKRSIIWLCLAADATLTAFGIATFTFGH